MVSVILGLCLILIVAIVVWVALVAREIGFVTRLFALRNAKTPLENILDLAVRRDGTRTLIELDAPLGWNPTTQWSPHSTLEVIRHLAGALSTLPFSPQDRVAIYKDNGFDIFLFAAAVNRLGGIAAPVNANLDASIAKGYVDRLGASILVTDNAGFTRLQAEGLQFATLRAIVVTDAVASSDVATREIPATLRVVSLRALLDTSSPYVDAARLAGDDPIYIFHTSGTTGVPKGVIVSAAGMTYALRSVVQFNLVSRRDLAYFALPLNHQVSHLYFYALFLVGIRAIIGARLDAEHGLQTIQERRASVFFGFPITYTRMLAAGPARFDLSSMRVWGTTADASHEVHQRTFVQYGSFFRRLGIPRTGSVFIDGLGSTEVGIAALLRIASPWTRAYGRRVGRPTPGGPRVKIVDPKGASVPRGEPGRLMIKGPAMFRGYWNAHDLLVKATKDGWWFTGDIVLQERSGEFIHLDREVDVIHGQTRRSYTLLIEEVVLKHEAVLDVSVFGVRVRAGYEVPAAVIALRSGSRPYEAGELLVELNSMLPEVDRLAQVWIEDWSTFPIGATGKTLRRKLRERFAELTTSESTASTAETGSAALAADSEHTGGANGAQCAA
jgi:acyl-coenzyme A synthetase/AMP-(fatty) acid ligase